MVPLRNVSILQSYMLMSYYATTCFFLNSCPNGGKTSAQTLREFGSMWKIGLRERPHGEDFNLVHYLHHFARLALSPVWFTKLAPPL